MERAKFAARSALGYSQNGKAGSSRGGRGGRGGNRGGRGGRGGGRGGGRDRSDRKDKGHKPAPSASATTGEEQHGEKRKRAVEPDGGPDVGVRGTDAPPMIQTAKKVKTDGEAVST